MKLEIELWHLISLALTAGGAFFALVKMMLAQFERRETERHEQLREAMAKIEIDIRADAAQWGRIERELLALKAELPINYVRRDDFVRVQSVIEAKLDGLALRIENASLKRRGMDRE